MDRADAPGLAFVTAIGADHRPGFIFLGHKILLKEQRFDGFVEPTLSLNWPFGDDSHERPIIVRDDYVAGGKCQSYRLRFRHCQTGDLSIHMKASDAPEPIKGVMVSPVGLIDIRLCRFMVAHLGAR